MPERGGRRGGVGPRRATWRPRTQPSTLGTRSRRCRLAVSLAASAIAAAHTRLPHRPPGVGHRRVRQLAKADAAAVLPSPLHPTMVLGHAQRIAERRVDAALAQRRGGHSDAALRAAVLASSRPSTGTRGVASASCVASSHIRMASL